MPRCLAQLVCFLLLAFGLVGCNRNPSHSTTQPNGPSDPFLSLMNAGKNYLDQGDATNALGSYKKAQAIVPSSADVRLNLANSYLIAGDSMTAIQEAEEALKIEPDSAAAYFIRGSAQLRLSNYEEAVKAFENAKKIEPGETATLFQLGMARIGLKQWDGAVTAFQEGIATDPNHLHTAAHYQLAQALLRAGRSEEARKELEQHEANTDLTSPTAGIATFERSKYTRARVPFKLDQPNRDGIKIRFVDATREVLGDRASDFSGPIGVIDVSHKGVNSLFVLEKGQAFRLLQNVNGIFKTTDTSYPTIPTAHYSKMLVGDLQNDRFDDVIVLGDKGSQVFKFGTNGLATEVSSLTRLRSLEAADGILVDLDFTGKLDLVAVTGTTNDVRVFRQLGPLLFTDITGASGISPALQTATGVTMDDWNRDEIMDLIVGRRNLPPLLLEKQRGGILIARERTNWVAGTVFTVGDFDNDLRPDLAIVRNGTITLCFNGGEQNEIPFEGGASCRQIMAVDYDNDGWLDLCALGEKIRVWRNVGLSGFQEQTTQLGLDTFSAGPVSEIHFADFDKDCDLDAIVALRDGGLRYLRNEGGNANSQVKVQLAGNRSNASGIGCKIEIETGGLRLIRTVRQLPVEVGVGKYQKLDSFLVHWFNWPQGSAEMVFSCKEPIFASELTIQEGSCPYLYAWDGTHFRFVTDILGAAPLGLPIAEGRLIEADPKELVWIGNEQTFPTKDGGYQLQITEELREVLYLDEVKLVVVDHEPGTEVHPTNKLLPGKPFPPGTILTLHKEHPLQRAESLGGQDLTSALKLVDGRRASPDRLRVPQLRGLAEPHGVTLDFGPLDVNQPLVLVMNGWLRFGGGMANIAASQDPSLPFPFPSLEAEVAPGKWKSVDVTVGAPAGKTKTILVDLSGKLEPGSRRLRLTEAFEIHWDRIALMEKKTDAQTRIVFVAADQANLHFRGFSPMQDLPFDCPLTPDYSKQRSSSYWTLTPGGWCTRYGDISELVQVRDEGLALLNGGDELSLTFQESSLPSKPIGSSRDFFLSVDGWDKDSDFHVVTGTQVEPLPFHGLNDARYGRERRPAFPSDALHNKYNTRWVEGRVLKQTAKRPTEPPHSLQGM